MNTLNKIKEWFKSLSTVKKVLVIFGVIILIALSSNDRASSEGSNFYKKHFKSSTGSAFGQTGYNRAIFEEDGTVEYCNMWKETSDKNASFHPSNMTKGTWKFIDNDKKKIEVVFSSGNNMDKSGIWEFTENYQGVKLPSGTQLAR
jgi:hypothetical protein